MQTTGFDISCKLSPLKTICMTCQNLQSGKNMKNITIWCLLIKFYPECYELSSIPLTLSLLHTGKNGSANNVDPDEMPHYKPSHQDLHCFSFSSNFVKFSSLTTLLI